VLAEAIREGTVADAGHRRSRGGFGTGLTRRFGRARTCGHGGCGGQHRQHS